MNYEQIMEFIDKLPSVTPKYTDEEIREALTMGINALITLDNIRDEIRECILWNNDKH